MAENNIKRQVIKGTEKWHEINIITRIKQFEKLGDLVVYQGSLWKEEEEKANYCRWMGNINQ